MKVYMVRHGESEGNAYKIHSGWSAVPLTKKGKEQARATAALLEGIEFDRIYVSDLARARQTAELALPGQSDRFLFTEEMREYNNGPNVVGRPFAEMEAEYGERYLRWRRDLDYSEIGGETQEHFFARVSSFMRRLEADAGGGARNVAVVTHAGTLRNVLQYVIGLPYKQGVLMSASNCSVNLLEYRDGGWRILAWNYLPALPRDAARAE